MGGGAGGGAVGGGRVGGCSIHACILCDTFVVVAVLLHISGSPCVQLHVPWR